MGCPTAQNFIWGSFRLWWAAYMDTRGGKGGSPPPGGPKNTPPLETYLM